jgi:hypothetical protein
LANVPVSKTDADGVTHNYALNTRLKEALKTILEEKTSFSSEKKGLVVKSTRTLKFIDHE